ncbi:hypothetical protein PpBr36_05325 [Pyricularia pennisetigena]|uniref:hypothetical protein n=1 Tax=Pyricularia pennisetigena TaxID=1578925 RepID=UPI001153B002|nr:hypothetical protein PpBr36_05325 [Pyricularia pennisetigena]TLS26438.1 hypothetical protein PpBr36_05325 [Pyricularia pennisetigena]
MSAPVRISVLASGNGSNFQALIDAVQKTHAIQPATIVRLVANRKNAHALVRASDAGIPTEYFNLVGNGFQKTGEKDPEVKRQARENYDAALAALVLRDEPDLVVLAGWMHVFSEAFLRPLEAAGVKCINLHPALPGKYDGANAIGRAHQDFQDGKLEGGKTGIMIHYVIAEVDRGAPIMVQEIECRQGETLEELEQRIHSHEHELIVKATAQVVKEIAETKKR